MTDLQIEIEEFKKEADRFIKDDCEKMIEVASNMMGPGNMELDDVLLALDVFKKVRRSISKEMGAIYYKAAYAEPSSIEGFSAIITYVILTIRKVEEVVNERLGFSVGVPFTSEAINLLLIQGLTKQETKS